MVRTGNRAVTLDQDTGLVINSADSLITTFNLSNYISSSEDLWLTLYFRNEGIDFSAAGNKIWIRGSDRDAWIPVYTLPWNPADFGVYRAMPNVNITQTLANASPVQTITSSFQVKCGQEGSYSAGSGTPGVNNDGFTFDDIIIGFLNRLQPMQLESFTVTKMDNTVLLQWSTYTEINTDRFIIERSTDSINYMAIGSVPASGYSNTIKQYKFTDEHPATGINYYRIKQTDFNGKFSHSPIRSISVNDNFTITIKPNPVTQGVLFIKSTANCTRIELREVTGRLVKAVSVNGMQTQLPVHGVAKGIYFVTVVTDNGSVVKKVLVE
jgi:hypothetical protein